MGVLLYKMNKHWWFVLVNKTMLYSRAWVDNSSGSLILPSSLINWSDMGFFVPICGFKAFSWTCTGFVYVWCSFHYYINIPDVFLYFCWWRKQYELCYISDWYKGGIIKDGLYRIVILIFFLGGMGRGGTAFDVLFCACTWNICWFVVDFQ